MSKKMNYGPRFESGVVHTNYVYDRQLDLRRPVWLRPPEPGTERAIFREAKVTAFNRDAARKRNVIRAAAGPSEYELAERRLIDRIREAVELLSMGLDDLNGAEGKPTTGVSRKAVFDILQKLQRLGLGKH